MAQLPILSLLIWLPVLGAMSVLLVPNREQLARSIALLVTVVCTALCIPLYLQFDITTYAWQFRETLNWIPTFGIHYDLGVDGISMPLVILTVYTTLIVVIGAYNTIRTNVAQYLATFLIMQSMVIGVFVALDSILFYVFWEAMLIPMYLAIGIWGSQNKTYAAIKFFLYTFFGSALLLVAILFLGLKAGSFYLPDLYALKIGMVPQILIFIAFLMAFAVKVPMVPVHTWLPDAHTEAPAGGSVILAALMLKVGGYGFIRFSMPVAPDASHYLDGFMIALSLIAIVYISLIALAQKDMKKLIAYSSVAHMGFVTLGFFMIYSVVQHTSDIQKAFLGMEGGMVQMISHAFGSGAMFLAFGMLYDRMHTRQISEFGGLATTMPKFAAFFMIFCLTNVGLPGTSGFVGEFMVILASFQANFWIALAAATTLVVGAAYTLWMYKRVFYGEVVSDTVSRLKDIDWIDWSVLFLLALGIFFIGLYPQCLLRVFHSSVEHILQLSLVTKI